MGEALGIPEWLAQLLFVGIALVVLYGFAWRSIAKQIQRTSGRRPSPSREQFITMMSPDVTCTTAEFLWDICQFYLEPHLTPHPDDDLAIDLPIDEDDWSMDWPRQFAARHDFHESNLADWPEGWVPTIRNYGRWLDMAPTG